PPGLAAVLTEGGASRPGRGEPPIQLLLGRDGRISGRLVGFDEQTIRVAVGDDERPVAIARGGVRALLQRPGEALVFRDGFEALDESRWSSRVGAPGLVESPKVEGVRSLSLPAGGSAMTAPPPEPAAS